MRGDTCDACNSDLSTVAFELQEIVEEHKLGMSGGAHLELNNFALRMYSMLSEPPCDDHYDESFYTNEEVDSLEGDIDREEWAHDVLSDDELCENDDARLRMPSPAERKLVDAVFSIDQRTYTSVSARWYLRTELSRHLHVPTLVSHNGPEGDMHIDAESYATLRRHNSLTTCYKEAELKFSDVLRVAYDGARLLVMQEHRFRHARRDVEEAHQEGNPLPLRTFWLDRTYIEETSAEHPEYIIPKTRAAAVLLRRVGAFHHRVLRSPGRGSVDRAHHASTANSHDEEPTRHLVVTPALVDLAKKVHRGAMRRVHLN